MTAILQEAPESTQFQARRFLPMVEMTEKAMSTESFYLECSNFFGPIWSHVLTFEDK